MASTSVSTQVREVAAINSASSNGLKASESSILRIISCMRRYLETTATVPNILVSNLPSGFLYPHWMAATQTIQVYHGRYLIEQSDPPISFFNQHPILYLASNSIFLLFWSLYIIRQIQILHLLRHSSGHTIWLLWTALVAEVLLAYQEVVLSLSLIIPLFHPNGMTVRPRYRLLGSITPTIDVCVTCCGEPTEVIVNTIAAAAAQEYPAKSLRILVLDDGNDHSLKNAVSALAKRSAARRGPRILYRARQPEAGVRSYFKSGNLRFGIAELTRLGRSELFANLDCDMITEPDWLRRLIPHLILDPAIALVNPPQVCRLRVS